MESMNKTSPSLDEWLECSDVTRLELAEEVLRYRDTVEHLTNVIKMLEKENARLRYANK